MRLLRIELTGHFQSSSPSVSLESEPVRAQLLREIEHLGPELAEGCRQRVASYFPSDYTVFVRMVPDIERAGARFLVWIDDPTIGWPAGLLARRAWKLSVPVLSHALADAFASRLNGVRLVVDRDRARIVSLAPRRLWSDPLVLFITAATCAVLTMTVVIPLIRDRLL